MPRPARDSDEEVETKSGRRTRGLAHTPSVDSSLRRRRSTRISQAVKYNDSSADSSLSDCSNISNTQAKTKRKQNIMDTAENQRSLRTRKSSVSSDVTEYTEGNSVPGTPVKVTRSSSRTGKQYTRASSEAKSSPTVRATRRTRASSEGPEAIDENKLLEKVQYELTGSRFKTRRRTLLLPSEATVIEEKEILKIPVVQLQRALPNIKKLSKANSSSSANKAQNVKLTTSATEIEEGDTNAPDDAHDRGESESSVNTESVKRNASVNDETLTASENEILIEDKDNEDTVKETEIHSESVDPGIDKKLESKRKDIHSMKEQDEVLNNKENETLNIMDSSKTVQDTVSTAPQQSPKRSSLSGANKLTEDKWNTSQANSAAKHDNSAELSNDSGNIVTETENNTSITNDSETTVISTSENVENHECSFKMASLIVNSELESAHENVSSANLTTEMLANSSKLDSSTKNDGCSEETIETNNKKDENDRDKMQMEERQEDLDNKTSDEDDSMKMEISIVEETVHEYEECKNDNTDDILNISDKPDIIDITDELKNVDSNSSDLKSEISPHKSYQVDNASKDVHVSSKDTSINKKADDTNETITIQCSTNTTPDKCTEKTYEKDEVLEKTSAPDETVANENLSIESVEKMDVDDNEYDTNAASLFQDIAADEWKEENNDTDKNSVHSVSTERLENESEGECDIVLVDRDAWLASKNMKVEDEKEISDYDSDDTVLIKNQTDRVNSKNKGNFLIDISEEEQDLNVSENKDMNTSKENRSSVKQTEAEDKEESIENNAENSKNASDIEASKDTENTENLIQEDTSKNTSISEITNQGATSKSNTSIRKSITESSLSKLPDGDVSTNSPLNKSTTSAKKRISLNKSIQKLDNESESSGGTKSVSTKNPLDKSEEYEPEEAESNNKETPAKKSMKISLNSSSKKKKPKQLDASSSDELDNDSDSKEKQNDMKKKKINRNYSTVVHIGSNSDINRNSESDDSQDESRVLPKFIFNETSSNDSDADNESNKSIDSDIEREYNLQGKSVSKFSDDEVPGDECRASETESSDPDDNGSDLADFVVDDDEEDEEDEDEDEDKDVDVEEVEKEENEINVENEEEDIETKGEKEKEENEKMEVDSEEEEAEEIELDNEESEDREQEDEENVEKSDEKPEEELQAQDEDEEEKIETINKSLSDTKKGKRKSRSSLNASRSEKDKEKCNTSSLSNSFKTKKINQLRSSGEFIVESFEQPLNESQLAFNTKTKKIVACSTPKGNSCKFDTTEKLSNETNLKKLKKLKNKENLMHKSLSPNSKLLVEKTDLSKAVCSEKIDLYKTMVAAGSETPTIKHLRKEKLNESAPEIELGKFTDLVNSSTHNEESKMLNQSNQQNVDVEEYNEETAQEAESPLKRKILKVANAILETDKQKRKRQKRSKPGNTSLILNNEETIQETEKPRVVKSKKQTADSGVVTNKNEEQDTVSDKKKRKRKKVRKAEEPAKELHEDFAETKTESNDEVTHKNNKKKKRERIVNKNIADTHKENQIFVEEKVKNKKVILSNKADLTEKLPRKKDSGSNITSDNEEVSNEKLPKKKNLTSKTVALQNEDGLSSKKILKKKQKLLSSNTSSVREEISNEKKLKEKLLSKNNTENGVPTEELPNKKQKKVKKLLENKVKDVPLNKRQHSSNTVSRLENPDVVAFSKARDEALKIAKHAADNIKANKEMKKTKQKELTGQISTEGKTKVQKLESKHQSNANKTQETRIKRLPDEILENLSDVPLKPLKKRKLSKTEEETPPSLACSKVNRRKKVNYEKFIVPSTSGGTTKFVVEDLQEIKRQKKIPKAVHFRAKMLSRNARQPVSAYLMYLEKQISCVKNKFCN